MKRKELQGIVRKTLNELINEDPAADKNAISAESSAIDAKILALQKKKSELSQQDSTLAEMARTSINYTLADDYQDKIANLKYVNQPKRMAWINGTIDYINDNGPSDITTIAKEKFGKPQPALADYARDMIRAGILVPEQAGVVPQFMRQTPSTPTTDDETEEDNEETADDSLAAYFDDVPNNDGSEDFNDDEEPTIDVDGQTVPTANVTDEDYEAFMKYSDLEQRLTNTKSNIQKLKRSRGGSTPGDVKDTPSTELERLRALKISLENRINDLVQSSPYLQNKINNVQPEEPEIEEPEIEDDIEELDEWTINKLKYYAGITK